MASIIDFPTHERPRSHMDPAQAQRLYERITRKAAAGRRHHFRLALEAGQSVEDIAAATGLQVDDARAVLEESS